MRFSETDIAALQAKGIKIPTTHQKKHAKRTVYAHRGMGLQSLVSQANEQYKALGIAHVWDPGVPARWIGDKKLVPEKATVDHIGSWKSYSIAFDDKETRNDSLPAGNVPEHQINFLLDHMETGKGYSFLLVGYAVEGRFFLVPINRYFPFWVARKGLKIEDAEQIGIEVFGSNRVCLDYLKALEKGVY